MPSKMAEPGAMEKERAELDSVLRSPLFARSPTLAHLLSYLCEKLFVGEGDQIKEYSIAVDVFGRGQTFDQDLDSIVRVQANRLRKRLAEFYSGPGASHALRITIPVGQYVPVFEEAAEPPERAAVKPKEPIPRNLPLRFRKFWLFAAPLGLLLLALGVVLLRPRPQPQPVALPAARTASPVEVPAGLPVGDEVRILAGATRGLVDRSGKPWLPDAHFSGGAAVRSAVTHIWRTQDPAIYRTSRQGDFSYNIPLRPGTYELHLHFAETFYGPEDVGGGGEGSRIMSVTANGKPLLDHFDVLADAGGGRTADVRVFTGIKPENDGVLRLNFSSVEGGRAMVSAVELLPGASEHMRPVRIVARDMPYYSDDSRWWSADMYFKGGQLRATEESATGTDDPEFYATERWGHFSYAIPVAPGRYRLTLYFIEHRALSGHSQSATDSAASSGAGLFNVFCNRKLLLHDVNILKEAGRNQPLVRRFTGLEPNAQGKLLLEFVPIQGYATVSAIEIIPE
ncbi:MAG: malectin domain-containing carbohydrate-binding protein [Chlamydiota bacterium]